MQLGPLTLADTHAPVSSFCRMLEMAREGRDKEDGWQSFCTTSSDLEVYRRDVKWSKAQQMRTVLDTDLDAEVIFKSLVHSFEDNMMKKFSRKHIHGVGRHVAGDLHPVFVRSEKNWATMISYRIFRLP